MNPIVPSLLIATGSVLASRIDCHLLRLCGVVLVGSALALTAVPALADEHILAADNGEVRCQASKSDLTRISLKDDQFVSVSRVQTGVPQEDFSIVHEPTRGDIYISVPEGFTKDEVSFFGTTAKGFVYKFACRLEGERAHQVFVENRDILGEEPAELARAMSPEETSASLIQAMYQGQGMDGFEIRQGSMRPVMVGPLKVQMITEYRGLNLVGRVLRIENTGKATAVLNEQTIAPSSAVAVSVARHELGADEVTTAYIITPSGQIAASSVGGRP